MDDYVENYLESHDIYIPFTELVEKYKKIDDLDYHAGLEELQKMTECEEDGYCISEWFQEKMGIHMKYQLTNPNGEYYDAVKHHTPIPHCFDYFVADYTKMKDEVEKLRKEVKEVFKEEMSRWGKSELEKSSMRNKILYDNDKLTKEVEELKKEIEELKVHNTRGHIITEGIDMPLTEVCDKYLELKKENEKLQEQGQGLAVQYAEVCKDLMHLKISQHPNHDLIPKDLHGWEAIEKLKEDEQEWCEEECEWLHYSETKKWQDAHR